MVKQAFQAGNLPPDLFPLDRLGGTFRFPNMSELSQVLDLQHFVRSIEHMYLTFEIYSPFEVVLASHVGCHSKSPDYPKALQIYKSRFYRAALPILASGRRLLQGLQRAVLRRGDRRPSRLSSHVSQQVCLLDRDGGGRKRHCVRCGSSIVFLSRHPTP